MKYLVEATDKYTKSTIYDTERSAEESKKQGKDVKYFPNEGEQWIVNDKRKDILVQNGFVKVIKEITETTKTIDDTDKSYDSDIKPRRRRKSIDD